MVTWQQTTNAQEAYLFCDTLKCAKSGNVDAIAYLYHHFHKCVFGYIFGCVKDRQTAEDLTSDVFLKMVERVHTVRSSNEAGFRAWLLKVAKTTIAQHLAREKIKYVPLEEAPEFPCVTEKLSVVAEAFDSITEEQKQAIDGTIILGYDAETVGRMMGKKANTVRGLQFRGLTAMKRILIALLILFFLGITIKLIQIANPSSPHVIKSLGKHVVFPHKDKSPEIHPAPHQDSTVAPRIQPITPKITPTATSTTTAISVKPTSTPTVIPTACVASVAGICF
jgi:RNA polymerase sigma-70 factor (ECF subfamily)